MPNLEDVASEVLSQFEDIATAAKKRLDDNRTVGPSALASINMLNSESAVMTLRRADNLERESCRHLANEPAIARVLVEDELCCSDSPVVAARGSDDRSSLMR